MSNYPPGVSGNEYEIAGADYEHETEAFCGTCGKVVPVMVEGYRGSFWANCEDGHTIDDDVVEDLMGEDEPDFEAIAEARAEAAAERYYEDRY